MSATHTEADRLADAFAVTIESAVSLFDFTPEETASGLLAGSGSNVYSLGEWAAVQRVRWSERASIESSELCDSVTREYVLDGLEPDTARTLAAIESAGLR